jgi:predicted membrane-bound spermidine synthase
LLLVPKLWAKRASQVTGIIVLAYAVKTYILFTSCYNGICPEKKIGIFIVMISSLLILLAGLFTGVKIPEEKKDQ